MTLAESLLYLRSRAAHVAARDSQHRPHWTADDLEAVLRLIERPAASSEQIALARIEGIASSGYTPSALPAIRAISIKALGL